jgi:flagellar hook-basal body complex protein FliE
MTLNSSAGANAYSAVAKLANTLSGEAKTLGVEKGPSEFGSIVDAVLSNVSKTGATTEAQAANLANGNADVLDLVTAVAETELAVETLVTVRDRVISAYQDILNMPI